jgi:hypothetical protein
MAANEIKVVFGGGLKVDAEYHGHLIRTDQPVRDGGEGTAPSPFDLFLAPSRPAPAITPWPFATAAVSRPGAFPSPS